MILLIESLRLIYPIKLTGKNSRCEAHGLKSFFQESEVAPPGKEMLYIL